MFSDHLEMPRTYAVAKGGTVLKHCFSYIPSIYSVLRENTQKQGSRDGAVERALANQQCGLGSFPAFGVICLVLAPRGFSPGFPLSSKTNTSKFQSIWKVSPKGN